MIRIGDSLGVDKPKDYIDAQVDKLWLYLNPTKKAGGYKVNSIINKLQASLKNSTDDSSYKRLYADGKTSYVSRHRKFYRFLLVNSGANLMRLIKGNPNQLEVITNEIMELLKPCDLIINTNGVVGQTKFGRYLSEKIFNYQSLRCDCKKKFFRRNCIICKSRVRS